VVKVGVDDDDEAEYELGAFDRLSGVELVYGGSMGIGYGLETAVIVVRYDCERERGRVFDVEELDGISGTSPSTELMINMVKRRDQILCSH
jgi:hypothetical protein